MGGKFTRNKDFTVDNDDDFGESQESRLKRKPTHRKCEISHDEIHIGYEIFNYRGGL
jgi:hypothetical protein